MATLHDTALASDDTSGTTLATADALTVTAGDLVVVGMKWEGAITTVTFDTGASTPTFTAANAAENHVANTDLNGATAYWLATSSTTINPRAVLGAARPFRKIKAYSFTPAGGTALSLDAVATAQQTGNVAVTSGAASATAAGCAVGFFHLYGPDTLAPGTGWSEAAEFDLTDAQVTEYRLQSGSGSITADGTLGSGFDSISQLAIFKETAAAGDPEGRLVGGKLLGGGLLVGGVLIN